MTNPKLPNPFNSHEDWGEWFNKDRFYRQSLTKSWKMYIKQNPLPNTFFMKLHTNYLNFVHFVTKNAIVATAVCLVALTAVSASAAQLVAPVEYRPSTIASNFFANKQVDKNPYTALKPDENNDVVISESCDLAIKYPKQILNSKLNIYREWQSVPLTDPNPIDGFNLSAFPNIMEEFESQIQQNVKVEAEKPITIRCLELNKFQGMKKHFENKLQSGQAKPVSNNKSKLQEMTGWFVTQASLENFQHIQGDAYLGENLHEVYFTFKNKIYWLIFETQTPQAPQTAGIFANQIQLQFNSLVKNEANKEILAKSESVASVANSINSSQKSQDNSQVITKTLTFAGEGYGHVILHENQMTPGEGNKFIASYYTKARSEFTNTKSTGGAVPEFRVVGKIKENPKTFELFDKITVKFELFDVEKVEQINIAQNSVNSPFSLSGKGCVGSDNNTKCEIMENGKAVTTIRTCGLDGLCLTSIEQGAKTDDYQYFYSPGYEGSGLTIYPFNIKTKKMEKSFEIMDPCARMDINSLEYKTCFEGEKIKQYNQDYLKYVGQKPQEYLPQNEEQEFVNSVFTLVKKDGNTLYWTSDLVCQPDSNDCTLYSTTQDFRTPEDIKSNQIGVKYEISSGSSKRNDKDENRTFTKIEKTQKVAAINGETFTFYGLNISPDKTMVNWTKDSECPKISSACKLYSSWVNFLTEEDRNSTEKVKYKLWGSSKRKDDSESSVELTKWVKAGTNQNQTTGKTQTYTNQYYPSLKINYDDSWKMKTDTSISDKRSSDGSPLINRTVRLNKDGSGIAFRFYVSGGFGGGGDSKVQGVKIANNIYRYGPYFNRYDYIATSSTTNSNSGPTYEIDSTLKFQDGQPVKAQVVIDFTVDSGADNSQILKEAEEIIKNSSFGTPIR
jgi:hypothetical protein